ncbi:MAG: phosphoglucosamine mutase, partial [Opitutales bacterium]|nr:phosphoglucosamine mutase [Opitutales bacterium]
GENSGHFIFSEISPCGDGLAAALSVLSVMKSTSKKLSQLRGGVAMYPNKSKALKVERKTPIEQTPNLSKSISECEQILGTKGRLLVRYSGTEKKIRLLVEAKDVKLVDTCMQILEKSVENDLQ